MVGADSGRSCAVFAGEPTTPSDLDAHRANPWSAPDRPNGAAKESNLPSGGLPRPAGFEADLTGRAERRRRGVCAASSDPQRWIERWPRESPSSPGWGWRTGGSGGVRWLLVVRQARCERERISRKSQTRTTGERCPGDPPCGCLLSEARPQPARGDPTPPACRPPSRS